MVLTDVTFQRLVSNLEPLVASVLNHKTKHLPFWTRLHLQQLFMTSVFLVHLLKTNQSLHSLNTRVDFSDRNRV